ncbi:MAG TPA: MATE family efflux transporter [Candidatus Hydrogenedens sp.]|nr:MATE family efflux transporter [Candidatus Hydrogenedens sp.]
MKRFDPEIVSGSVLNSLWKLTWPLVLLNLANGVHGFIDQVLIGHFVPGEDNAGNAAVGVSWQLFIAMVVLIASISHGMNVLIARYAGRQDKKMVSIVFFEALLISAVFLVGLVAPLGYWLSPQLLRFIGVEECVYKYALPYLRLLFAFNCPLFLMILTTGAFQAAGEPKLALKLNILGAVLNVVLSCILITGLGIFPPLGVIGAGIGTVLAPCITLLVALYLMMKGKTLIEFPAQWRWLLNLEVLKIIIRVGLPTGIQGVVANIAGVLLIKYIGSMPNSTAAQAAYTICYNQLFLLVTWTSFGLRSACATVMSQNIGAGLPERGKKAVRTGIYLGSFWGLIIGVVFIFFSMPLLHIFNAQSDLVVDYGRALLKCLAISGILLSATLAMTGGIQGAGATQLPMLITLASQFGVLLGACEILYLLGALNIYRIWYMILLAHFVRYVLTFFVFRTDGWIRTKVELSPELKEIL